MTVDIIIPPQPVVETIQKPATSDAPNTTDASEHIGIPVEPTNMKTPAEQPAQPIMPSEIPKARNYYKLINVHSGKVLDVSGGSKADGTAIIQWTDNGGMNQHWALTLSTGGAYQIFNRYSGKFLNVVGGSTSDGAAVIQSTGNGDPHQLWNLVPISGNTYKLINTHSGKALNLFKTFTNDGGRIDQWTDNGGTNQQWALFVIPNAISPGVIYGTDYKLINVHSGKALDISGRSKADGVSVIQSANNGDPHQLWTPKPTSTRLAYRLFNRGSSKVLDVSNNSKADGATVIQWTNNRGMNQKWVLKVSTVDGTLLLVNLNSSKVLTALDSGAVIQSTDNGGPNQLWKFVSSWQHL